MSCLQNTVSPLFDFHQAYWRSVLCWPTIDESLLFYSLLLLANSRWSSELLVSAVNSDFHSCWSDYVWFLGRLTFKDIFSWESDKNDICCFGQLHSFCSSFVAVRRQSYKHVGEPSHFLSILSHLCFINWPWLFFSVLQCAQFSANIEPAPRMTSAATINVLVVAWNPTQPVIVWPAAASITRATVLTGVLITISPTKDGAASLLLSARISITNASRRRSVSGALTAMSMSSTTVPASLSAPPGTRPSTHPCKWTLSNRLLVWWNSVISEPSFLLCLYVSYKHIITCSGT